jgi:hypothetical protein
MDVSLDSGLSEISGFEPRLLPKDRLGAEWSDNTELFFAATQLDLNTESTAAEATQRRQRLLFRNARPKADRRLP